MNLFLLELKFFLDCIIVYDRPTLPSPRASSPQPTLSVGLSMSTPISASSPEPSTSGGLCVICISEKSCYAMVPCGHLLMCDSCKLEPVKCYICQRLVHKMIKIYNV
jgi:hypothetical protein